MLLFCSKQVKQGMFEKAELFHEIGEDKHSEI